ncbi:hypothetical protein C8F04DRAFT_1364631 [Mycena alexandri]|uniref:Uncharacterized protein n=1 Tax=Mycena alexandri TaxID=1745969 RepID=A0AAD6X0C9_9AGAR|nr:hypothetical protein C8F04DRAFT_1364631 [Mycena alexandri]
MAGVSVPRHRHPPRHFLLDTRHYVRLLKTNWRAVDLGTCSVLTAQSQAHAFVKFLPLRGRLRARVTRSGRQTMGVEILTLDLRLLHNKVPHDPTCCVKLANRRELPMTRLSLSLGTRRACDPWVSPAPLLRYCRFSRACSALETSARAYPLGERSLGNVIGVYLAAQVFGLGGGCFVFSERAGCDGELAALRLRGDSSPYSTKRKRTHTPTFHARRCSFTNDTHRSEFHALDSRPSSCISPRTSAPR